MTDQMDRHSRRDLLKKTAIGAAAVWATPLVMSSPAFAATGCSSGSRPCTKAYYRKIEGCIVTGGTGDGEGCPDPGTLCAGNPLTISTNSISPDLTGCHYGQSDTSGTYAVINFPPNAIPLAIQTKPGTCDAAFIWENLVFSGSSTLPLVASSDSSCSWTFTKSGTIAGGLTVTVVGTPRAAGNGCKNLSHVNVWFCL